MSAPVRRGDFEYFTRTIEGQQYDVHCRRPAGTPGLPDPDAPPGTTPGETVVLDENALAAGPRLLRGRRPRGQPRPDRSPRTPPTRPAVSATTCASATLATGADLDDVVPDVYYGVAWANDDRTVLFTRPDDAMRPWQVVATHRRHAGRRRRARVPGGRRPLLRVASERTRTGRVLRDHVGVEGDHRGAAGRRRRRRPPTPASSSRASRVTSTTSSTTTAAAATGSSCSPTPTAPRTSR